MKYFTRTLYNAIQDDPDLPSVIEAETKWDNTVDAYDKHLCNLKPLLPKSMQQLCETSFHDGIIESYTQVSDEVQIKIDGCGCWGPGGALELVFSGVKSIKGIEDTIDDWWLYEEVHPSDEAGFEYHVLLTKSELIIAADEIKLIQEDKP